MRDVVFAEDLSQIRLAGAANIVAACGDTGHHPLRAVDLLTQLQRHLCRSPGVPDVGGRIDLHSSLVGATDDVVLPAIGDEPDWELELGVVIGRGGRLVTLDEAQDMIAGYTIVNDIGTVDVFRRTDIPWGYDWVSKHQPTFKVAGPFVVPAQFFTLDDTIRTTLSVDGRVMQGWPTKDMIFDPAQFVTYASERVNLTPGSCWTCGPCCSRDAQCCSTRRRCSSHVAPT